MECGAFCCVCVCLCPCLSLYGREVAVGYARLRGGVGATFCHLAALRSAILNFSSGSLGSLGNGRFGPNPGREVTGGYGRLRAVTEGETEESGGTAGKR